MQGTVGGGGSTVPCDTPEVTGAELNDLPSTTTFWVLSDRKLLLKCRMIVCLKLTFLVMARD